MSYHQKILDVEVLLVVECKNSPKSILADILTMDRGLRFFSGQSLPGNHPKFKSTIIQVDQGPTLRFTPDSFRGFVDQMKRAKRLLYLTRPGPLGPSNNIVRLLMQRLMETEAIQHPGTEVRISDAVFEEIKGSVANETRRTKTASSLITK
eukprot:scaffold66376_cov41-Prasinocladus_malaysianus.AAC.1